MRSGACVTIGRACASLRISPLDRCALDAAQAMHEQRCRRGDPSRAGARAPAGPCLRRPASLPVAIEARARRRASGRSDGGREPGHAEAAFLLELHAVALDELRVDEDAAGPRPSGRPTGRRRRSAAARRPAARPGRCPGAACMVSIMSSMSCSSRACRASATAPAGRCSAGVPSLRMGRTMPSRARSPVRRRPASTRRGRREARADGRAGLARSCAAMSPRLSPRELLEQRVGDDEATMASPTTAAAVTAHTSLRSMAAGDSSRVVEVHRSQRLHQRRDRLHVAGDAKLLAVGDAALRDRRRCWSGAPRRRRDGRCRPGPRAARSRRGCASLAVARRRAPCRCPRP